MPNPKGNDGRAIETRRILEALRLEIGMTADDADLLSVLLMQLERRFDRPPDALTNATEIAMRIRKSVRIAKEILDQ